MAQSIEVLRNHLVEANVIDPEGTHHEFSKGMHGRKIDFDTIPNESELYLEWVYTTADYIGAQFPRLPGVILGVANGTNRLALSVAREFDGQAHGLKTEKDPQNSKIIHLTDWARRIIDRHQPELVVVVEDVGTTGSNSVQAAVEAKEAGAQHVEVVVGWKRRPELEELDAAGVPYRAMIDEPMPTLTPEDCQTLEDGFCFRGWELIPRET